MRLTIAPAMFCAVLHAAIAAAGQPPAPDSPPSQQKTTQPPHDMQHAGHGPAMAMPSARDASGTSWLPDESPIYGVHAQAGSWMLMGHGHVFLQYVHESGDRGSHQLGSINWFMGMADRTVGRGRLELRGMVSLEPWTIRGCGYPDALATGEVCDGEAIHDRQHPHDLVMELAASYDRPLARGLRLQLYGGPAGEPALGPTAFPHRLSAMPNPLAPITHHWFDATHITFGVLTAGVYGERWKAETSVFNGREPDERRTGIDLDALDSWSGRAWWLPSPRWALQISAGRLTEAESGEHGGPRIDVTRVTASATYHRIPRPGRVWATTVGWGRNDEEGGDASNAWLAETNLTIDDRDAWFGRFEWSQKSAHDLGVASHDLFTVAKLAAGYTRYGASWYGLKPGIGGGVSVGIVPDSLEAEYGRRVNAGVALFLTLRPALLTGGEEGKED